MSAAGPGQGPESLRILPERLLAKRNNFINDFEPHFPQHIRRGAFGAVFPCRRQGSTGEHDYAVKVVRKSNEEVREHRWPRNLVHMLNTACKDCDPQGAGDQQRFQCVKEDVTCETTALMTVKRHRKDNTSAGDDGEKNVVRLCDLYEDQYAVYIVMPRFRASLRDLRVCDKMPDDGAKLCDDSMLVAWIIQGALQGLCWMHDKLCRDPAKALVHFDIKLENIMVDGDWNAVLVDLGFATMVRKTEVDRAAKIQGDHQDYTDEVPLKLLNNNCTPGYQAPERTGSTKSDIWALGVVMFRMLDPNLNPDQKPFNDEKTVVTRHPSHGLQAWHDRKIQGFNLRQRWMDRMLRAMLCQEPTHRPCAAQLLDEYAVARSDVPRLARHKHLRFVTGYHDDPWQAAQYAEEVGSGSHAQRHLRPELHHPRIPRGHPVLREHERLKGEQSRLMREMREARELVACLEDALGADGEF